MQSTFAYFICTCAMIAEQQHVLYCMHGFPCQVAHVSDAVILNHHAAHVVKL